MTNKTERFQSVTIIIIAILVGVCSNNYGVLVGYIIESPNALFYMAAYKIPIPYEWFKIKFVVPPYLILSVYILG